MKGRICLVLFLVTYTLAANSVQISTTVQPEDITTLTIHTTEHPNPVVKNLATMLVNGLQAPCTKGIYIATESNKSTYSAMLSAYIAEKPVTLYYNTQKPAPWGDTAYCALVYLTILK